MLSSTKCIEAESDILEHSDVGDLHFENKSRFHGWYLCKVMHFNDYI